MKIIFVSDIFPRELFNGPFKYECASNCSLLADLDGLNDPNCSNIHTSHVNRHNNNWQTLDMVTRHVSGLVPSIFH